MVAEAAAVSDLTRLLVLTDVARGLGRRVGPVGLGALCYLIGTDPAAGDLRCAYSYQFNPGPSSVEFEADLAQLEAAGLAERSSPLTVSAAGAAWLDSPVRAGAVSRLREIAADVLPAYVSHPDLVAACIDRGEELAGTALELDRREADGLAQARTH
jgi:hypothetical protein